ncbi:hypothetical protein LTR91_022549 [Friedmanniomyces endolithicus]|uniref:BSD domain-containing protein n=1 Tax=Friedmanniomyces endolithicus TaxID=329885 RepID=A0AAN6H3R7_9PEZI|nr:hypothetical protein LTR94_023931 [Friedmanniomyces endolithicus]KAK0771031.1 hypothetical protein LTR59_016266 [Friedmanniomyces endolithicus]KAK0773308.1 hypothetical protein LTR75_017163 [Friedmanniomyces endolithicus]KAK0774228.1 hypothetical protein LTR38_016280 [Friedmanniomyces endolithicus]KAK0826041.1 hypothetical protein LTR03_017283 [Friedmanniomyces endolithicus]
MDIAYDHVQEEALSPSEEDVQHTIAAETSTNLNADLQQAFQAGESFELDLQKEAQDAQEQATQGWSNLTGPRGKHAGSVAAVNGCIKAQGLEHAADEALLKFGNNIRNFLRDAVIISAPTHADTRKPKGTDVAGNEVIFETLEPGTGKKVFHSTRLDARLHAIDTTVSSFTEDPQGPQWDDWKNDFGIEQKTTDITLDLDKYEELRRAMEKVMLEKVQYKLSAGEKEEGAQGRRSSTCRRDVAWDDDDEDGAQSSTPDAGTGVPSNNSTITLNATSTTDTNPASSQVSPDNDLPKLTKEPCRNNEDKTRSMADSDVSHDIVSGAMSRAGGGPKEGKRGMDKEESDDDWE